MLHCETIKPKISYRIEAIASLADLEETSESTLRSLVSFILSKCDELLENEKQQPSNPPSAAATATDDSSQKKPPSRGPTFNLNGVNIYARQIRQSIAELEPLHSIFAPLQSREQRMRYTLLIFMYEFTEVLPVQNPASFNSLSSDIPIVTSCHSLQSPFSGNALGLKRMISHFS